MKGGKSMKAFSISINITKLKPLEFSIQVNSSFCTSCAGAPSCDKNKKKLRELKKI